jgi:hypothetical protein
MKQNVGLCLSERHWRSRKYAMNSIDISQPKMSFTTAAASTPVSL